MLRRSELPSVVTTNYAGLALNLQLQLANSRATLLMVAERCRRKMLNDQEEEEPPPTPPLPPPLSKNSSSDELSAIAASMGWTQAQAQAQAAYCPESPVSFPSSKRPAAHSS